MHYISQTSERNAMNKDPFYSSLSQALEALYGPKIGILSGKRIFGGDINTAERLTLSDGSFLFVNHPTHSF